MLEGRDHHDSYASSRNLVGYSALLPGTYTLKLRTEHSQYIHLGWPVDAVTIHVPIPWWETWWLRGSFAIVSLGLFFLIYNREVSRLRRERRTQQAFSRLQIESQEAERKRLAAELHDGLGQNLLLASNELQQFLQQHDGAREEVQQAAHLLQESIHSVREMASNLHPHQLERLGFTTALTTMVDAISHATGLTVHLKCENIDRLLPRASEVHLYRIAQEALSNVVRHSSARNVSIEIQKDAEKIKVVVRDNGKGFDGESVVRSTAAHQGEGFRRFGLSSMSERARIIGGTLNIESDAGKGTVVFVSVPYV